jgi:hypothetical protein
MPYHQNQAPLASWSVQVAAKARHQLQHLPDPLRLQAEEILHRLEEDPLHPTADTGRMRVGVANRYAYHARLDFHHRIYWTVETDGSVYVWQVGGHLPLGMKHWS